MIYQIDRLVISDKVSDWCRIPYPNHPKGCPNYGKKPRCPPNAPKIEEYFDISKPLYLVHSEFDLSKHVQEMKDKHPTWSDLQCRCVLYWQSRSRKQLMKRVEYTMIKNRMLTAFTDCPEGMGLNVYATARLVGLKLEKIHNLSICRHVALVGTRNRK